MYFVGRTVIAFKIKAFCCQHICDVGYSCLYIADIGRVGICRSTAGHVGNLVAAVVKAVFGQGYGVSGRAVIDRNTVIIHNRITGRHTCQAFQLFGKLDIELIIRRIGYHADIVITQLAAVSAAQDGHRLVRSPFNHINVCRACRADSGIVSAKTERTGHGIELASIDCIRTLRANKSGRHILNTAFPAFGAHGNNACRRAAGISIGTITTISRHPFCGRAVCHISGAASQIYGITHGGSYIAAQYLGIGQIKRFN